ncbi:MAG: LysR family glycine cleavage system transcriptional activator [Flavobacteriales bacterium]|jgi:LysR family glycine cleavage system transcriptional activator
MKINSKLISHLPYLAEVAKHKSFTKAAITLNLTQAAVSYQIKQLEEKLETSLIIRGFSQELRLTRSGEILVDEYRYCAKRLNLAFEQLAHKELSGELRLSAPVDFGSLLMPKVMAKMKQLAPKLVVNLHTSDHIVDLERSGWEMAIRVNNRQGVQDSQPIYCNSMSLVASSAYFNERGRPKTIDTFDQHTLLTRAGSKYRAWSQLMNQSSLEFENCKHRITLGNSFAIREGAKEGLGIGILPGFIVERDINDGTLHHLFPDLSQSLIGEFYIAHIDAPQMDSYEILLRQAFKEVYGLFSVKT